MFLSALYPRRDQGLSNPPSLKPQHPPSIMDPVQSEPFAVKEVFDIATLDFLDEDNLVSFVRLARL